MLNRIAIIDDDQDQLDSFIEKFGSFFEIESFNSSKVFQSTMSTENLNSLDAIIIDLEMPEVDGLSLIRHIKESYINSPPIIVLTHFDSSHTRIAAYSNQVTDLLNKNLADEEVLTRIKNSIALYQSRSSKLIVEYLKYDENILGFRYKDDELALTGIETKLLYALLIKYRPTVGREDILDSVWQEQNVGPERLRTHLYNLNSKIKQVGFYFTIRNDSKIHLIFSE